MQTNILLENGTNELEILEFKVAGNYYGINVAKIREIIPYEKVTDVPNSHPSVEGIFMPRDVMITVINLSRALGFSDSNSIERDMMIITNFNKLNIAFHVNEVMGIHRVSWSDIIKPDATLNAAENGIATGVIKIDKKLIMILDFEKIVSDIAPETGLKISEVEALNERERNSSPILIAEDSPLLNKLICESLKKSGYENIILTTNGSEAWELLTQYKESGDIDKKVKCIITDIEMPIMDGHRLTKLAKSDDIIKKIPLVIFSSLINEEMRAKGKALGADAQLTKPEIGNLINVIDSLIAK